MQPYSSKHKENKVNGFYLQKKVIFVILFVFHNQDKWILLQLLFWEF